MDRIRAHLPACITVWACPLCGYWRQDKSTGYHLFYEANGPGQRHGLVQVEYVREGEVVDDA